MILELRWWLTRTFTTHQYTCVYTSASMNKDNSTLHLASHGAGSFGVLTAEQGAAAAGQHRRVSSWSRGNSNSNLRGSIGGGRTNDEL